MSWGYDLSLFISPEIHEALTCPICTLVMRKPVQCSNGHAFCLKCICEWLKISSKCPLCNVGIDSKHLFPVLSTRKLIESLSVLCPTSLNGNSTCNWTGTLASLESHLNCCSHIIIPCINSPQGCTGVFYRSDVLRESSDHLKNCLFQIMSCPNNPSCGKMLYRKDIESHLNNECFCHNISYTRWLKGLCIGDTVDAKDHLGDWYEAVITSVRHLEDNSIFNFDIHFKHWGTRYDMTVKGDDVKTTIAPLFTKTKNWRVEVVVGSIVEYAASWNEVGSLWVAAKVTKIDPTTGFVKLTYNAGSTPMLQLNSDIICNLGTHIKDG